MPKYKPLQGVLTYNDTTLNEVANRTYENLNKDEKEAVDALTTELDEKLRARSRKPTGLGIHGLRELALALVINLEYPDKRLDGSIMKGIGLR